jgi:hypothetical protein
MPTDARPNWPELKRRELEQHPEVFAAYEDFKRAVKSGQRVSPERPFILVRRPEELPSFASEDEEHEYWGVHEMGDGFFEQVESDADAELPPPRPRPAPIRDGANA